jgi:hypothetical protein
MPKLKQRYVRARAQAKNVPDQSPYGRYPRAGRKHNKKLEKALPAEIVWVLRDYLTFCAEKKENVPARACYVRSIAIDGYYWLCPVTSRGYDHDGPVFRLDVQGRKRKIEWKKEKYKDRSRCIILTAELVNPEGIEGAARQGYRKGLIARIKSREMIDEINQRVRFKDLTSEW